MYSLILILTLIIVSGLIASIGDYVGLKIGKKRVSIFGLRPHYTAIFITIITGILIAILTITVLTITSQDVRTALFGMEELKEQLSSLSKEVENRNIQLSSLQEELKQKSNQLQEIEEKFQQLSQEIQDKTVQLTDLLSVREDLIKEKEKLTKEIEELNNTIKALYTGITWMREGEVIFGPDEQIAFTVIQGGKTVEEINEELIKFLNESSELALSMGAKIDERTEQVFVISQQNFDSIVENIHNSENSKSWVVRLLSAINILKGEPVLAYFTLLENRLIFQENEVIITEEITSSEVSGEVEKSLISLLRKVNLLAVEKGIIPEPKTSFVGYVSAANLYNVVKKIEESTSPMLVSIISLNDTWSTGPLRVRIEAEPVS
ncbi:MAG: DUF3084 domain-containing protein [Candidatus Caldatribacteriota bacterium]